MYNQIIGNILDPVRWHYNLRRYRRYLEESQWYDRKIIEEIQFNRLKELLKYSYQNVEYYREKFEEAGFDANNVRDITSLHKIPILTREDVRKHYDNKLLTRKHLSTKKILNTTSGSTGTPMLFYQDYERNMRNTAVVMRSDSWASWTPRKKIAYIWLQHLVISSLLNRPKNRIKKKIRKVLAYRENRRKVFINPNELGPSQIDGQLERLYEFRPEILLGYVSAIHFIAKHIQENDLPRLTPEAIILTSEPVFPFQASTLAQVFNCPIFRRYATRELGTIAMECEKHQYLHINAENVYVEVVKDGMPVPPGKEGEIVVTDLTNYTMPFIRYNIEDISSLVEGECACGRKLPLMRHPMGRSIDMFYGSDGRRFYGAELVLAFAEIVGIKKFQVRQQSLDHVTVKVVKGDDFSESQFSVAEHNLLALFGPGVKIDYSFIDRIPRTKSGKFRYLICDVKPS